MNDGNDEALRKLFLGGLDREKTSESELKEYFGVYGTVVDCVVIRDNERQKSKGFGFVTMASVDETDAVLLDKDDSEPHIINGKKVEVKRAIPRGRDILADPIKKLFIAGFKDANLTEEDLKAYFADKCTVDKVHIVKDKETGKQKGYCFVELSNRHMADKAAIVENHTIKGISIIAKKATPKGDEGGASGGRGGGRGGRGRGGYSGSYGGGGGYGGYGGGDYSGYGMEGSEGYGNYGGERSYGGSRGGRMSGRGGRGGGGGSYGSSGGGSWGGNGYDSWGGSGGGGYDAGSNYAGSSSNYGPMKGGYNSGGGGGGGGYGSSSYGSGGSGGYSSGGYGGGGGRGGRPY